MVALETGIQAKGGVAELASEAGLMAFLSYPVTANFAVDSAIVGNPLWKCSFCQADGKLWSTSSISASWTTQSLQQPSGNC